MKEIERVDYHHYGDQLDRWQECVASGTEARWLVNASPPFHSKTFQLLNKSILHRERFRRLKVRGFSYRFCLDVGNFGVRFEKSVNLRAALFYDRNLFYPKKVRSAMGRVVAFHCRPGELRPIAFALGRRIANRWFVLQIQSDVAYRGGAALGNHFRGWSRVLLDSLVCTALGSGGRLYVCPCDHVIRAVEPKYRCPESVPTSWRQFYDASAEAIGMKLCRVRKCINLQLHPHHEPVLCREFFSMPLMERRNHARTREDRQA